MLPFVAALIAMTCALASARRLFFALTATALEPALLATTLRGDAGRARFGAVCEAIRSTEEAAWERELILAVTAEGPERTALINEALMELDYRVQRWARVPRVCASIATSSGFLLATIVLRQSLVLAEDLADGVREAALHSAVTDAINVAAIGLAGAAFCIAIQFRARRAVAARAGTTDKLVERLESLASAPAQPAAPKAAE